MDRSLDKRNVIKTIITLGKPMFGHSMSFRGWIMTKLIHLVERITEPFEIYERHYNKKENACMCSACPNRFGNIPSNSGNNKATKHSMPTHLTKFCIYNSAQKFCFLNWQIKTFINYTSWFISKGFLKQLCSKDLLKYS